MAKQNNKDYTELLTYIQKLRLDEDNKIINEKLEKNKIETSYGTTWDKFKIGLNNFRKSVVSSAGSYEKKNNDIKVEIARFMEKNPNVISSTKAKSLASSLEKSDSSGINSLMFDISVILDSTYSYVYEEDCLNIASKFLHDDERLVKIKTKLERAYKQIANKGLSDEQKKILVGVALASLAAVVIAPVSGAIVSTISGVKISTGLLFLSASLIGTAALGITYATMKGYNEAEVRKAFKNLTPDETAMQLAIQCVVIDHLRSQLSDAKFKEKLDKILKELDLLKSDLDYYFFVEKQDVENNKKKIGIFHGFERCLIDILDL